MQIKKLFLESPNLLLKFISYASQMTEQNGLFWIYNQIDKQKINACNFFH